MSLTAVIFDVDGTLVDVTGLRHWVTGKRKDFDKFHTLSASAPPIPFTQMATQWYKACGLFVLIVTARSDRYEALTKTWLAEHNIPYDRLYMRKEGDYRPDREVKQDMLDDIISGGYEPIRAFDDNPSIIELWKENSIPVHVVPGWED